MVFSCLPAALDPDNAHPFLLSRPCNGNAMNARIEPADWVLANNSGNTVIQWSAFHSAIFFLSPPGASVNVLASQPYSISNLFDSASLRSGQVFRFTTCRSCGGSGLLAPVFAKEILQDHRAFILQNARCDIALVI